MNANTDTKAQFANAVAEIAKNFVAQGVATDIEDGINKAIKFIMTRAAKENPAVFAKIAGAFIVDTAA